MGPVTVLASALPSPKNAKPIRQWHRLSWYPLLPYMFLVMIGQHQRSLVYTSVRKLPVLLLRPTCDIGEEVKGAQPFCPEYLVPLSPDDLDGRLLPRCSGGFECTWDFTERSDSMRKVRKIEVLNRWPSTGLMHVHHKSFAVYRNSWNGGSLPQGGFAVLRLLAISHFRFSRKAQLWPRTVDEVTSRQFHYCRQSHRL